MSASFDQVAADYARGRAAGLLAVTLVQALVECRESARAAAARGRRMGNPEKRIRVALALAKSSHGPLRNRARLACRVAGVDFLATFRELYRPTSSRIARRALDRMQPERQAVLA